MFLINYLLRTQPKLMHHAAAAKAAAAAAVTAAEGQPIQLPLMLDDEKSVTRLIHLLQKTILNPFLLVIWKLLNTLSHVRHHFSYVIEKNTLEENEGSEVKIF